jgi:hypothetical protein
MMFKQTGMTGNLFFEVLEEVSWYSSAAQLGTTIE